MIWCSYCITGRSHMSIANTSSSFRRARGFSRREQHASAPARGVQRELHFTQQSLTWVMNGYLITFGGFLLLAGRMGDLVGRKKVFLVGLVLFTAASILCGAATDQTMLIVARFLQG